MKIVKVVYEKITGGRGRPSKFYELEDGTKVAWREFGAKHPEIVEAFENEVVTPNTPKITTVESVVKQPVKEVVKEKEVVELGGLKGKVVELEGTISTRTVFGTPVNLVHCMGTDTNGIDLVRVIANAKTNREYSNYISAKDIVKPEGELPEEFHWLKFAGE